MTSLNLDKSLKYLLACSYGPDSMALFDMLKKEGYKFDAAIVNYHLRKESDLEVSGLLDYANKNGVKIFVFDNLIPLNNNIESRCREIRYSFFKSLYKDHGYDALLVAHHQDDHLETYLMQKQRQISPIFYGINEKSMMKGMTVLRPLLGKSKAELLQYCKENDVPFAIDQTNFDTLILRNHIRHEVIGKMSELERLKLLQEIDEKNQELKTLISKIDKTRLSQVQYLLSLDKKSFSYALNMIVSFSKENERLSKENVGEIRKALSSKKPNIITKIKRGLYLVKEYDLVSFQKSEPKPLNYSYLLNKPGMLDSPYFFLDFSGDTSNRNVSLDDYPLTIRNAKEGDHTFINGYKVLIRRLFIDWKMPLTLRMKWPVIINKNGEIIYVPRYQKDFKPCKDCNFFVKI